MEVLDLFNQFLINKPLYCFKIFLLTMNTICLIIFIEGIPRLWIKRYLYF